jgi:predicted outer membrane protein
MTTKLLLGFALLAISANLPAADTTDTTPKKRGALVNALPNIPAIDGVSKEEIEKFKVAFQKSATDENVKAARAKLADYRSRVQYASADEKKDLRTEGQALTEEMWKSLRVAIAKNDSSLKKETVEKICDAIEDSLQAKMKENQTKATGKNAAPTKPFPFGDKPKTDDTKTPATTGTTSTAK